MEVVKKDKESVTIKFSIPELFSLEVMKIAYKEYLDNFVIAKPDEHLEIRQLMKEIGELKHEYEPKSARGKD